MFLKKIGNSAENPEICKISPLKIIKDENCPNILGQKFSNDSSSSNVFVEETPPISAEPTVQLVKGYFLSKELSTTLSRNSWAISQIEAPVSQDTGFPLVHVINHETNCQTTTNLDLLDVTHNLGPTELVTATLQSNSFNSDSETYQLLI